ncbi:MAG: hypothetical protein KDJ75_04705 [Alphaproteobacteria bacterium]|nr:hypothetical protein [Alphaproteobacteria bacterium]
MQRLNSTYLRAVNVGKILWDGEITPRAGKGSGGVNFFVDRKEGESLQQWAERTKRLSQNLIEETNGEVGITQNTFKGGRIVMAKDPVKVMSDQFVLSALDNNDTETIAALEGERHIQLHVCGTRALTEEEAGIIEQALRDVLKNTDCENFKVTTAHYDWGPEDKFRGHINVDLIESGQSSAAWRLLADWHRERDVGVRAAVSKALVGTELESVQIQTNSHSWVSPQYEQSDSYSKACQDLDASYLPMNLPSSW